jgi:sporulation protein YlmC with PRC-barrel domain
MGKKSDAPKEGEETLEQADNAIDHWRVLDVRRELRNLLVRWRDGGALVGKVTDAVISPEEGEAVGLSFQGISRQEYFVRAGSFMFREDQVWVEPESVRPASEIRAGAVKACRILTGTMVLTNEGYVLGHIRRIYLRINSRQVIYQVTESWWHQWTGRGFFIPGHIVKGYSRDGTRMIVPFNAREEYANSTLSGLIISQESETVGGEEPAGKRRER